MLLVRALEPFLLPPLALVTTKVVNVEGAIRLALVIEFALQLNQPFAAGVNGKSAKVGHNPATPQPLRHRARRAATTENVRHEISFIGAGFDDAFEQGFGFLSCVSRVFVLVPRTKCLNVGPQVGSRHPRRLVEVFFEAGNSIPRPVNPVFSQHGINSVLGKHPVTTSRRVNHPTVAEVSSRTAPVTCQVG